MCSEGVVKVTTIAPVNIATIKYWGKKDEELILPLNDSISVTLSCEQMHAKTTIMAKRIFVEDRFWLNGVEESVKSPRLSRCISKMRELAKEQHPKLEHINWKIHICSRNNFPTAAGLASSAAGYACLVYGLSKLYNIKGDITEITRLGSGSACRSVYGGFVRWHVGVHPDGSDSIATQVASASSWADLKILILVVSDARKKKSSTGGMRQSVETSELLKCRVESCVPDRVQLMIQAIKENDFQTFGRVTMQDSNQFHAICMDTYPPAVYLTDVSHSIINFVHQYNNHHGTIKVAYTFDAGPNAVLFVLNKDLKPLLESVLCTFPPQVNRCLSEYIRGLPDYIALSFLKEGVKVAEPNPPGLLKYIISTKVGEGPRELSEENELLASDGLPK